ncbi:hypothetical protein OPV22_021367 [Ensete ventricosum]|uniref:Dof-type domain-containing protein n=1 Tax=Ensete ventricosum TaxID=4639 RepID=A0AAV8QQ39_ENSVE|nr:hypothetical protein OPV22_021367 [Ensete ventricosum]
METPNARNQAMASHQLEGFLSCPKNHHHHQQQQQQERKQRPHPEQALKCPRKAQDQDLMTAANSFNPLLSPTFIPPLSSDLTLAFAGLHKQPPNNHGHSLLLGHPNTDSLPSVTTNHGFLDILRSDSIDSINPSGLDNYLYYGFGVSGNVEVGGGANGEDDGFLSFHGGLGGATATAAASQGSCKDMDEGETKVLMGGDGNLAVDSGREWTAVGSSWHGLINSSLMSGAGIDVSSTLGDAHAFF